MFKKHTVASIFFSVGFMVLLQELSFPRPIFRFLAPAMVGFLLILTVYNWWYLHSIEKYNVWNLVRPVLFFVGSFALFNIIPVEFLRGLFLLSIIVFGSVFEIFLGNFAENLLINEILVIAFSLCMSAAAYALLYFPSFEFIYLLIIFFGIAVITRAFYEFTPLDAKQKLITSLVIALFCTEAFWVMSFLPLHFSAIGLLLFNVFYFCFILNYYFIFNTLNIRKFQFHAVLFAAGSIFILLITPWKILTL